MDMNELKKLADDLGGILVMNGNAPEFVILPYGNYRKMEEEKKPAKISGSVDEEMIIDKLNKEILTLKEEIRQKEEAELIEEENKPAETDQANVDSEDLPA